MSTSLEVKNYPKDPAFTNELPSSHRLTRRVPSGSINPPTLYRPAAVPAESPSTPPFSSSPPGPNQPPPSPFLYETPLIASRSLVDLPGLRTSPGGHVRHRSMSDVSPDPEGRDSSAFKAAKRDWNLRFQQNIALVHQFSRTSTTPQDWVKVHKSLYQLSQDFLYSASLYGRVIISEVFLAHEEKTIKPVTQDLGGIAGGEKFIINNILFKFALDSAEMYGSDYNAAKVAGNELRGLTCYSQLDIEGLHVPLMALIDFRGFRLVAISLLPINQDSIVYGSADAGTNIHNSNAKFEQKMKLAGDKLNLKSHRVGDGSVTLHSPIDLEGHRGFDGRFYLVDFSRVLPPETPIKGARNPHLYRLLRPEFLHVYHTPLCSDAFTGFSHKADLAGHNAEIREATNHLFDVLIPSFARELDSRFSDSSKDRPDSLTQLLHGEGINIRHMGLVRKAAWEPEARRRLLIEMCGRVLKNSLRLKMRKTMEGVRYPLERPFRKLTVKTFNVVFGRSNESRTYWCGYIKFLLTDHFGHSCLSEEEHAPTYDLRQSLRSLFSETEDGRLVQTKLLMRASSANLWSRVGDFLDTGAKKGMPVTPPKLRNKSGVVDEGELSGLLQLFLQLSNMTGIKWNPRFLRDLEEDPSSIFLTVEPLDETDLLHLEARVKHMNIIQHAAGFLFKWKGIDKLQAGEMGPARRFFQSSLNAFEEALLSTPNNMVVLKNTAHVLSFIEKLRCGPELDPLSPGVRLANKYFLKSIELEPHNSQSLVLYAKFLAEIGKHKLAERYFLDGVKYSKSTKNTQSKSARNNTGEYGEQEVEAFSQFLRQIGRDADADALVNEKKLPVLE